MSAKKAKLKRIDPHNIVVPKLRMTATWQPELYELFKASIADSGIDKPICCVYDGENYILWDGKHRLDEALMNGINPVECLVVEGTMKDVKLRNIKSQVLQGGKKASELIALIGSLQKDDGMTLAEIQKETGLSEDYVTRALKITSAIPEVLEHLDEERISIEHAYQISRVTDRDAQLRLLGLIKRFDIKAKEMSAIADETNERLIEKGKVQAQPRPPSPIPIPVVECALCEQEFPVNQMRGINVDARCFVYAKEHIDALKKGITPTTPKAIEIAKEVTEPSSASDTHT